MIKTSILIAVGRRHAGCAVDRELRLNDSRRIRKPSISGTLLVKNLYLQGFHHPVLRVLNHFLIMLLHPYLPARLRRKLFLFFHPQIRFCPPASPWAGILPQERQRHLSLQSPETTSKSVLISNPRNASLTLPSRSSSSCRCSSSILQSKTCLTLSGTDSIAVPAQPLDS